MRLLRQLFGVGRRSGSLLDEEIVQSPGRTALKNFFSKKLAILGMVIFAFIFFCCFVLSRFFFPLDTNFVDSTQQNIPPGMDLMTMPEAMRNNAKLVSVGAFWAVGVDNDNNVHLWGKPTERLTRIPEDMGNIVQVAAGLDHILALNDKGEIFTWGNNRFGLEAIPMEFMFSPAVYIAAGNQISVAITDVGRIEVWGNEGFVDVNTRLLREAGERAERVVLNNSMGYAITRNDNLYALTLRDILLADIPEGLDGMFEDIVSTDRAAAALLIDGTVVTWGNTDHGALEVPDEIQGRVTALAAGRNHFTALLDDGTVSAWGHDNYNQASPPNLSGIVSIYSGYYQNYAIDESGNVHTWGLRGYLMGSDQYGRDMFRRVLDGGRVSLTVGAVSVVIAGFIGVIVGGFAGYYGGKTDMILMRFAEVIQAIPFLPLAIIMSYFIGNKLPTQMRMFVIMVILGILSWPSLARLTRGQILAARENEYVTAAKALGVREGKIIFRHIMPNVFAVVLVSLTLSLATCMIIESTLSFLGFGISEPNPSWGNMLSGMMSDVIRNQSWRIFYPSLALSLAVISINLVGDAFRDAIDPKSNDR